MEIIGGIGLILMLCCLGFLILLVVNSLLLWLAAGLVKIEKNSFVNAFLSTLAGTVAVFTVGGVLSVIPFLGVLLAFASTLLLPAVITMGIFGTTFAKALFAELIRLAVVTSISLILAFLAFILIGFEAIQGHASEWIEQLGSIF